MLPCMKGIFSLFKFLYSQDLSPNMTILVVHELIIKVFAIFIINTSEDLLHDPCLEIVTVHNNNFFKFWAKAFPLFFFKKVLSEAGTTFNLFNYDLVWAKIQNTTSPMVIFHGKK